MTQRTTPKSRDRSVDETIALMSKTRKVLRPRRLKSNHRLQLKLLPSLTMLKPWTRVLAGGRDAEGVMPRSLKMELRPRRSGWMRRRSRPSQ